MDSVVTANNASFLFLVKNKRGMNPPVILGGNEMVISIKKYIDTFKKQFEKTNARFNSMRAGSRPTILQNGSRYLIRPVSPDDSDPLFQMHCRLSKETLYYRYLALRRPSMTEMKTVCGLSVSEGAAFVAHRQDKVGTIVGVAYYRFDPIHPDEHPEFAIVVDDHFQGRGIGKALLLQLYRHAKSSGIGGLTASIHMNNRPMCNLLHRIGYPIIEYRDDKIVKATVHLHSGTAMVPGRNLTEGLYLGLVQPVTI